MSTRSSPRQRVKTDAVVKLDLGEEGTKSGIDKRLVSLNINSAMSNEMEDSRSFYRIIIRLVCCFAVFAAL